MKLAQYIIIFLMGVSLGVFFEYKKPPVYMTARNSVKTLKTNLLEPQDNILQGYDICAIEIIEDIDGLNKENKNLSAVIGHAYGSPFSAWVKKGKDEGEISSNLKDFFLSQSVQFDDVFFTGDILKTPTLLRWQRFSKFMNNHSNNIYIAPGNHDVEFGYTASRDIFHQVFGFVYPQLFNRGHDYFLIIDTIQSPWTISDDAIEKLNAISGDVRNLYIFAHNILRPNPTELANSSDGKPKKMRDPFELIKSISPKFEKIYIFSGDTGAFANQPRFECLQRDNVHFISQGLGGIVDDEIIIITERNILRLKL